MELIVNAELGTLKDFIIERGEADNVKFLNIINFYDYVIGWGTSIWNLRKTGEDEGEGPKPFVLPNDEEQFDSLDL